MQKTYMNKKGMTLLLSVMILSVVMGVGLTIAGFVIKEFKIATSSRDSVNAVYAADTGIECALFWEIRGHEFYTPPLAPLGYKVFPTSTPSLARPPSPIPDGGDDIDCFNIDISDVWDTTLNEAIAATTTFELNFPTTNACARVLVAKYDDGAKIQTTVLSRGYNTSCATVGTNPRAVERAIKVRYIFN